MKHIIYIFLLITLFLGACKKKDPETFIRPVKVVKAGSSLLMNKSFPGQAEAVEYSYVNFRVGGMLIQLNVEEGQNVKAGQVIAAIDPRDYNLQVSSTKASYSQAQSQVERYKNLYSRNAISKQEYEISQAQYENAKAAYNKALNDLKDTRLIAPFSGNIEKKYVENHQEVRAGDRIVKLINPKNLQFRVTIPENNIKYLRDSIQYSIELDINKGVFYNAKIKDIISSSVEGAGIPILLTINDPNFDTSKIQIMPGYTCNVKIETTGSGKSQTISIPLSAVYLDPKSQQKSVWIVDEVNSTVHLKPVEAGELSGSDQIIIQSGLTPDDVVVTAGVTMLKENEKVKILSP